MLWKIIAIINQITREVRKDNVGAFAAQATFFIILSAIPFSILFFTLLQMVPVDKAEVLAMIEEAIPTEVLPIVLPIVEEIYNNSVGVLSVAAVTAVWSSAKGVQYLSNGLNAIYNLEETRGFLGLRIRAIGYTLAFSASIVFTTVFFVFGNVLRNQLEGYFPFIVNILNSILSIRYVILFVFLFFLFLLILRFLPNRKTRFKNQILPALGASLAWVLLSAGLNFYVNFFDGFSMYGSMTAVMLLLMWFYFGMYILLLAAEIESIFEDNIRMWRWEKRREKNQKRRKVS